MTSQEFCCYVDESGDEGFQFEHGSSPWFFLSAVVVKIDEERAVRDAVDQIRKRVWKDHGLIPPATLHWKKLRHEQKVVVCQVLADKPYCQIVAGIDKRELRPEAFLCDSGYLYRYAARLLLERISWYVANQAGWTDLIFSNRARFREQELREYLSRVLNSPANRMKPVFDPQGIRVHMPSQVRMLQIADVCASAVAAAFNPDFYGNTHELYLMHMRRHLYRYQGRSLRYGLKLFPDTNIQRLYPFLQDVDRGKAGPGP